MISIIGSTGSIGVQALNVARHNNLRVEALVAHSNIDLLFEQVKEFNPQFVGIIDKSNEKKAVQLFSGLKTKPTLVFGTQALVFSCKLPKVKTILISVTGIDGIYPLIEGLKSGKTIALANKESVVIGGEYLLGQVNNGGLSGKIIPVDSEHSSIFQSLIGAIDTVKAADLSRLAKPPKPINTAKTAKPPKPINALALQVPNNVDKLILTASGGAFYQSPKSKLKQLSQSDIFHPNWKMGKKITLDSCTMMNKALEIIEAKWLFGTTQIDYCIHPDSIFHSFINFNDGVSIAHASTPNMFLPIQFALTGQSRPPSNLPPIALDKPLSFIPKNEDTFFAPALAKQAILSDTNFYSIVLNAANDAATNLFFNDKISFLNILSITKNALNKFQIQDTKTLEQIISLHKFVTDKINIEYRLFI